MTKILGTPFENKEGWKLGAMLKNGTIYLRNIDTEESIQDRRNQAADPRRCQMTSWGYNFEQFLLSGTNLRSSSYSLLTALNL
jgi:RAT1-interacting protein